MHQFMGFVNWSCHFFPFLGNGTHYSNSLPVTTDKLPSRLAAAAATTLGVTNFDLPDDQL